MTSEHKNKITDQKIVLYWNYKVIIAIISAIILVPIFAVLIFSVSLKYTAVNPNFYKENLVKADTYNRLVNEGIPALVTDQTISDDQITNSLAQKAITYVLQKSIPINWVEEKVDNLIDSIAIYLSKPSQEPKIKVELAELQTYLQQASDSLVLVEQIIPSCQQAENIDSATAGLLPASIDCSNMNVNLDEVKTNLTKLKTEIDQISVVEINLSQKVDQVISTISNIKSFISGVNNYVWGTLIASIILILIIILIQLEDPDKILKTLGLPISISSIFVFIVAQIFESITLNNFYQNATFDVPEAIQSIVNDLIKVNITEFFNYIKSISLIGLIVGIILFVIGLIIANRKSSK